MKHCYKMNKTETKDVSWEKLKFLSLLYCTLRQIFKYEKMLDSLGKSWVHYKESQSKGKNLEDDMQAVVLKFGIVDSFYLQILFNSSMTFKIKKYRQWKKWTFVAHVTSQKMWNFISG